MTTIYTLEEGQYIIGDPFEILPSSIYEGIWGNLYNYAEGKFSAHGNELLIYTTYYDENHIIYRDNIDREYIIKSNNICIVSSNIAINTDNAVSIDVLTKMMVYHSNKHLYFNLDETSTFCIDIGELETPDNISNNGSETNSVDEFVKDYSMKDYEHEFSIDNSSDEEFDAENVMKSVKDKIESGKALAFAVSNSDEDDKPEVKTTFSFFKKKSV